MRAERSRLKSAALIRELCAMMGAGFVAGSWIARTFGVGAGFLLRSNRLKSFTLMRFPTAREMDLDDMDKCRMRYMAAGGLLPMCLADAVGPELAKALMREDGH